ncbi:MAG: YbaY family lipoprotein [Chthoniobacterales bacterium]
MKRWIPLLLVVLAGCSALPEQGPPMKKLSGKLTFREMTALPATATAHMTIMPPPSAGEAKPIATADFPAATGTEIPFELKFPAEKVASGGEYFVFAQVLDHGKVWYSNLTTPLRINFLAEPGDVTIELRREKF